MADVTVHDVVPIIFAIFWFLRPHGTLTWRDAAFAALWPLAYAVYGLTRGLFDQFYPYFFMDPTTLSYRQIAVNLVGLVAAFMIGALLLLGISRALAGRKP